MKSDLKSVRDFFGEKPAAAVTQRHVEEFISMKGERKPSATVNRCTQLL